MPSYESANFSGFTDIGHEDRPSRPRHGTGDPPSDFHRGYELGPPPPQNLPEKISPDAFTYTHSAAGQHHPQPQQRNHNNSPRQI